MLLLFYRLPHSLAETPLKTGDLILEINGIPIVNQDQKEVGLLKNCLLSLSLSLSLSPSLLKRSMLS